MSSSITKFSKDHEFVRLDGTTAIIGITDFAQSQLGDIVFVELPAMGKVLKAGDEAAVVESVKAASEVYTPVSGKVIAVNEALSGEPGLVNADPMGTGWMFQLEVSNATELDALLDEAGYAEFTK